MRRSGTGTHDRSLIVCPTLESGTLFFALCTLVFVLGSLFFDALGFFLVLLCVFAPFASLFDAVEKQLGLKLEGQKRTYPVFVIDHIDEKPTDN